MKKLFSLLALITVSSFALSHQRAYKPRHTVKVYVRNSQVLFDRVAPVRVGRRILVPLRGVFEKMGATVAYDHLNDRVYAKRGRTTVILNLKRRTAFVNGESRRLDTWPKISKGHVLVPIRFIAEALNASVVYSAKDFTVRITPR